MTPYLTSSKMPFTDKDLRMVHDKNYETTSTLVEVMPKKLWPLFFGHGVDSSDINRCSKSFHWHTDTKHNNFAKTRKPSYRNDNRAMHLIYVCPENFRQSLSTPTATFAKLFKGFCSEQSCECAHKIQSS